MTYSFVWFSKGIVTLCTALLCKGIVTYSFVWFSKGRATLCEVKLCKGKVKKAGDKHILINTVQTALLAL